MKALARIAMAIGLFLSGFAVGVTADVGEAISNDSLVKRSVYEDAISQGLARQNTDGTVFWCLSDNKEVMARFDP